MSRASESIFAEQDMDECVIQDLACGQAGLYTHRSPVKETPNEDAALLLSVDEGRAVLAVADGLGGLPGGAAASSVALASLAATVLQGVADERELRDCILDGFEVANAAVLALGTGSGTTLAVVEISGDSMRTYHVGDSAILVVGARGKLKQLTVAHSPTGYAQEAGFLLEEEALAHEERHLVSNILGDAEMKIEIGPLRTLASRDTLLLASDGVTDNLRIEEITEFARKGPVPKALDKLVGACRERMLWIDTDHPHKPDDLTLVIFRRRPVPSVRA